MSKHWKIVGATLAALGLILASTLASTLSVAAQGPQDRDVTGPACGFRGEQPFGHMAGRLGGMGANSEAIAEALGFTAVELRAQLRDGATLADLAETKGVELATLRDLAQAERKASLLERVSQALEDGKITEAFVNWFKRGAEAGYLLGPETTPSDNPTIAAAAEALGLEPDDVELQMWAGRTLADLAERAGVDLADVQAAIEAAKKSAAIERIQQAVEDGKLTSEQAKWMIEGVNDGFQGLGRFGGQMLDRGSMPMKIGRAHV